jgi:hypothetical protein
MAGFKLDAVNPVYKCMRRGHLELSDTLQSLFLETRVCRQQKIVRQLHPQELCAFWRPRDKWSRWNGSKYSQALSKVCSLMTISDVSALGRDTRPAMAAASVSRMILQ